MDFLVLDCLTDSSKEYSMMKAEEIITHNVIKSICQLAWKFSVRTHLIYQQNQENCIYGGNFLEKD